MRQLFMGGTGSLGNASNYYPDGNAGGVNRQIMVAESGTLSALKVTLGTAPGGATSRTFTIKKNGVDTAVAVTISGANTGGSDTVNTLSVTAGDYLSVTHVVSGSPAASTARWAMIFEPSTAQRAVWGTSNNGDAVSSTVYGQIGGTGEEGFDDAPGFWHTESFAAIPWAISGTIRSLYISLGAALGAGASYTFDIMRNGAAVGTTVTISGAVDTAGSATGMNISISPGDTLSLRNVPGGAPVSPVVTWGISYEPATDGEWNISGWHPSGPSYSDGQFTHINGGSFFNIPTATEGDRLVLGDAAGTTDDGWEIRSLYLSVSPAPGAGQSRTFTVRKSGVSTALAVTLTTGTTGTATSTVTMGADDYLSAILNKSASPAALTWMKWSLVAKLPDVVTTPTTPWDMTLPRSLWLARRRLNTGFVVAPRFAPFPPPGPPLPDGMSTYPARTPASLVRPPLNTGLTTFPRPYPIPPPIPPFAPVVARMIEIDTNPSDVPGIDTNPSDTITLDPDE